MKENYFSRAFLLSVRLLRRVTFGLLPAVFELTDLSTLRDIDQSHIPRCKLYVLFLSLTPSPALPNVSINALSISTKSVTVLMRETRRAQRKTIRVKRSCSLSESMRCLTLLVVRSRAFYSNTISRRNRKNSKKRQTNPPMSVETLFTSDGALRAPITPHREKLRDYYEFAKLFPSPC